MGGLAFNGILGAPAYLGGSLPLAAIGLTLDDIGLTLDDTGLTLGDTGLTLD